MRILYLINFAGKAGTEKYVENLVRIFCAEGHNCYLAYNIEGELSEKMHQLGIPTLKIDLSRSKTNVAANSLAQYCKANQIDVIHAQFPRENVIAIQAKRQYPVVKVVFTSHLTSQPSLRWKLLNRLYTPKNRKIISVCTEGRELLKRNGVSGDKIVVIHNGIEPKPVPVKDKSVLNELSITDDSFVMSIFARLAPEKGIDFLLDSLVVLKSSTDRQFCCIICGDGELAEQLKEKSARLGLNTHVIFAGFRRDTDRILAASDLFLNSSSCNEALSFAILEAMSAGKPLVVTDVGGNSELAENCGIVVKHGDANAFASAIKRLMDDGEQREKLGTAAAKRAAESFDLNKLAWDVFETYK